MRAGIERYYNAPLAAVETIQALFAGTPAAAAGWLDAYAGAGAHHLVIRLVADDHHAGLEEFADLVMPLIRTKGHR